MLFLPVAMILMALAGLFELSPARRARGAARVMVCWMAAIAPITYRNWVMSGTPVLDYRRPVTTFIDYNLPPRPADPADVKYYRTSGNGKLCRRDPVGDPVGTPVGNLAQLGHQGGFILGMVHWMGAGTPHPELILTSLLYIARLAPVRPARPTGRAADSRFRRHAPGDADADDAVELRLSSAVADVRVHGRSSPPRSSAASLGRWLGAPALAAAGAA